VHYLPLMHDLGRWPCFMCWIVGRLRFGGHVATVRVYLVDYCWTIRYDVPALSRVLHIDELGRVVR
jgi:hypothetical protein